MIDLNINTDVARQILTGFIKSEVTRVGFSRAVVGLSGGIDSALSCVLAVEALVDRADRDAGAGVRTCWQCGCPINHPTPTRWLTLSY